MMTQFICLLSVSPTEAKLDRRVLSTLSPYTVSLSDCLTVTVVI